MAQHAATAAGISEMICRVSAAGRRRHAGRRARQGQPRRARGIMGTAPDGPDAPSASERQSRLVAASPRLGRRRLLGQHGGNGRASQAPPPHPATTSSLPRTSGAPSARAAHRDPAAGRAARAGADPRAYPAARSRGSTACTSGASAPSTRSSPAWRRRLGAIAGRWSAGYGLSAGTRLRRRSSSPPADARAAHPAAGRPAAAGPVAAVLEVSEILPGPDRSRCATPARSLRRRCFRSASGRTCRVRPRSRRKACMLASPVSSAQVVGTPTEVAASSSDDQSQCDLEAHLPTPLFLCHTAAGDCQIPPTVSIAAYVASRRNVAVERQTGHSGPTQSQSVGIQPASRGPQSSGSS